MTKEEAIAYCYENKDEYVKDFESVDEGIRAFNCLISILQDELIQPNQLKEYGMEYPKPPSAEQKVEIMVETLEDVCEWLETGKVDGVGFDNESVLSAVKETLEKVK